MTELPLAISSSIHPAERLTSAEFFCLGSPFLQRRAYLIGERSRVNALALPVEEPASRSLRLWIRETAQAPFALQQAIRLAGRCRMPLLRSQDKVPTTGPLARAYDEAGFYQTDISRIFEIRVHEAISALHPLVKAAIRLRKLRFGDLHDHLGAIRTTLEDAEILDGFELDARLRIGGAGRIDLSEGASAIGENGLCGFLVVERCDHPAARTITARWVSPTMRGGGLVNLLLLIHALKKAADANVTHVRFCANLERHSDTVALARRLDARDLGEVCGYVREFDR